MEETSGCMKENNAKTEAINDEWKAISDFLKK